MLFFLGSAAPALAQFRLRLHLARVPAMGKTDTIYVAGSFNRWNPKDSRYAIAPGNSGITIELPGGMLEYKFTKGSWSEVETAADGSALPNRSLTISSDTLVTTEIAQWADNFPKKAGHSTANRNVHIVDTAFYMPQLDRYRRVWIYLPPSYASSRKKYPVLYMHDGQNVFDAATSFSGEWGVDETLDTAGAKWGEMIVVAIDNGGDKRINEYAPYDMERWGKGEGDAYVDFLVQTLRPYINKHYRTRKCGKHHYIAGSSMGGLISYYALLKYPNKFGGGGIFSPAFWVNPQLLQVDPRKARRLRGRIYFFAGQQESEDMVPHMLQVFEGARQHAKADMQVVIRADGKHSESTWREEFPLFYEWLMRKD